MTMRIKKKKKKNEVQGEKEGASSTVPYFFVEFRKRCACVMVAFFCIKSMFQASSSLK